MTRTRVPRFLAAGLFATVLAALVAAQATHIDPPHEVELQPEPAATAKATTFARPVNYGSGGYFASSVAIADLNGDGKADLAVANSCQAGSSGDSDCSAGGVVSVLLGNGDGTFQPAVSYSSGGTATLSVAIADLNGDGRPDLVVANQCMTTTNCANGGVGVLLGNGDGTFQSAVVYAAGYGANAVAVGDLNGDAHPDLVVASVCVSSNTCGSSSYGGVSVLLANGDGTFRTATTYNSGGGNAMSVAIKDVNGDGLRDVIVANQCLTRFNCNSGGVSVLLGSANGTLKAASNYSSGGYSAMSVAVADVDGDGDPDVIVSSLCSDSINCVDGVVAVLINQGGGTFKSAVTYTSNGYGASSVAVGDVNGDGVADLVVDNICKTSSSCGKGGVGVLIGNGDGTFQAPLLYSSNGNDATSVAIADLNADDKPDLVTADDCTTRSNCSGTVAVLLNSTLIKTTTAVSAAPNPSAVGQQVTFTATMTAVSSVPDGETVTFYQGANILGTGKTSKGSASLTATFSKSGTFTIKASYPGDAFHKPSSGKVKQAVN
jgi:hypothetical protein